MTEIFDNKYEYVKELGVSGFGRVFLAKDIVAERLVAIKQLKDTKKESQKKLMHEIRTIAKLNNPNIVNFYHHFEKDDKLFLVMEYCAKGNLRFQLKNTIPDSTKALDIITTLTHALGVVHSSGFSHNDIKPENILITEDGTIKLADFGMTNLYGGTLAYMPPEELAYKERKANDIRFDTYSLSLLLLELLTGRNPFSYKTREEIIQLHESKDFIEKRLPIWQQEVLLKGLNMHPELRFQNVQELREALAAKYVPFSINSGVIRAAEISRRIEKLLEQKKWIKANTMLEFAQRHFSKMSVQLLLVSGKLSLLKNDVKQAQNFYTTALKLNPRVEGQKPLGWINLEFGNYPVAISLLSDFIQLNPHDIEAYNLLLKCYYDTGRYEAGIDLANALKKAGVKNRCIINNAFLCKTLLNGGSFSPTYSTLKSDNNPFLDYNYSILLENQESHDKTEKGLKQKLLFMDYRFDKVEPNVLTIVEQNKEPIEFKQSIIKVGREGYETNDIFIKGGTAVSRRHCLILNFKQDIWIYDLNSTGFTFNGKEISGKAQIINQSELKIHKTKLQITPDKGHLFGG